jgi:hypothetical protein
MCQICDDFNGSSGRKVSCGPPRPAPFKRLRVVVFVSVDLIDAVDGSDQQAACRRIWDDVETAISVACVAAGRVSIGDIALHDADADDVANARSGYHPVVVSVQTMPAEAAA